MTVVFHPGFSISKECAESHCRSCTNSTLYVEIQELFESLSGHVWRNRNANIRRKSVQMLYHIFLGISEMAELIRPYGFHCYETHACALLAQQASFHKIRDAVSNGKLKEAIQYESNTTVYDAAAPTLFFMPAYEVYGHALLFLHLPEVRLVFIDIF